MERIKGSYSPKDKNGDTEQIESQIEPLRMATVAGHRLPIGGPFTIARAKKGTVVLYVSAAAETQLYYSVHQRRIYWHEQFRALPGQAIAVRPGTAVVWTPISINTFAVEQLPTPQIQAPIEMDAAVTRYLDLILQSVRLRLGGAAAGGQRVAIAQSGGIDSLMVTWALNKLGAEVVPMTVCCSAKDSDIRVARQAMKAMNLPEPVLLMVTPDSLPSLVAEGAMCFECIPDKDGHFPNTLGNLLMARKCKELGITTVFTGHGQDYLHGRDWGLTKEWLCRAPGDRQVAWMLLRRHLLESERHHLMCKNFAACFRRYGVSVRHPYLDFELMEWILAQPQEIVGRSGNKPFARKCATAVLPFGPWNDTNYDSTQYSDGSGMKSDDSASMLRPIFDNLEQIAAPLFAQNWQAIANYHLWGQT